MVLPRLALKNALRKPGRSALTACSVLVGVTLTLFAWAFVDALDNSVIRGQIRNDSGHFRVAAQGYFDVEDEDESHPMIRDLAAVLDAIHRHEPQARLLPRLSFFAELSNGRDGLPARGLGIEPEATFREMSLPLERRLEGPPPAGLKPMWLGAELGSIFHVTPGDTLTVLARTVQGSYTADDFCVVGLVRTSNPAIDNAAFFVPLDAAQALLDAPGAATEVVGLLPSPGQADPLAEALAPELSAQGLQMQTWRERAEPLLRINRLRRKIFSILIAIVMLIAASGIANTVVMSCFERVHEIGTLRALGFQIEKVVGMLLGEAFVVGLAGAALGAGLGAWVTAHFESGLDITGLTSAGNYSISMSAVIYFALDWSHVAIAFTLGLVVTVVAAVVPAVKFSRLSPQEAMRR